MRGILDGDGSIVLNKKQDTLRMTITSGSKEFLEQIYDFLYSENIISYIHQIDSYYVLNINKQEFLFKIYLNMYQNATYFLKRKYEKFGSLVKKFASEHSVNSGKGISNHNPEPSFDVNIIEGAETRHGEPKLENI